MATILDGIRVAGPCPMSWDEMTGDDRSRDCSSCGLVVYNLSAMTTGEALDLVSRREGRTCVRFYRRADGTVSTTDCPAGQAASGRAGRRTLAALGAIGLGLLAAVGSAFGFGPGSGTFESPPLRLDATFSEWEDWALAAIGRPRQRVVVGEMRPFLGKIVGPPVQSPAPTPGPALAPVCED
jgi:hypothetical protein